VPATLTVLYDEDCGFCRATLALLLRWDVRRALLPEAIQSPAGQELLRELAPDDRLASAHVVFADGRVASGGDAVAPIARVLPAGAPVALLASALAAPTRLGYRWVARNRIALSRGVPQRFKRDAAAAIARHRAEVLAGGGGPSVRQAARRERDTAAT